jgi:chromosome segregation ATPase
MKALKLIVPLVAALPLVVGACEKKTPREQAREERIEARDEAREARQDLAEKRRDLEKDVREDLADLDRRWERFENRTQAAGYKIDKEAADDIAQAKSNYTKARSELSQALKRVGTASTAQWNDLKTDIKGAMNRADDALDKLEENVHERTSATPQSTKTPSVKRTHETPKKGD